MINGQQNLSPSAATGVEERLKCKKYEKACQHQHKVFVPFVMQTFGGIGSKGLDFLRQWKSRPACWYVFGPDNYVSSIRLGLSSRLIKHNSRLLLKWLQLVLPLPSGGTVSRS